MVSDSPRSKFSHPEVTAKGEVRAKVPYGETRTLWFNTGTLCNITCVNCYIESSPRNDRLVYLTLADVRPYLDELDSAGESPIEIGFTGGEPFLCPEILDLLRETLARGHQVLVLTNAMQPMMRPRVRDGLAALQADHGPRLTLRVSLDSYRADAHDSERGKGSFAVATRGLAWLIEGGFNVTIAGRTLWGEDDASTRLGFGELLDGFGLALDVNDPAALVLFPEMRDDADPPEITTACWDILGKHPSTLMCASQRMVVKRKGAERTSVVACTLLPYDPQFDLGDTLAAARREVSLNHTYCASFCVLGGGSCSA